MGAVAARNLATMRACAGMDVQKQTGSWGAAREEVYAYGRKEMMGVFVVNDAEWLGGSSQQVTGDSGLI